MRVADFIADFLAEHTSGRVYGICGGGAMHLNDAFAHHPKLQVITMHHEQAAAFAAEADARITNKPSVVLVTSGPGGANAVTGVACAWADSIPMIVIAGQVTSHTMARGRSRQVGINELPMTEVMNPITKYSVTIERAEDARAALEFAFYHATTGRMGPVFIEVPLDVQAADAGLVEPMPIVAGLPFPPSLWPGRVEDVLRQLDTAKRPVLIVGNGVRLAGACEIARRVATALDIPVISSWSAADILPTHPCHIGHCGLLGDRASNWVVQDADFILSVGCRLSVGQIGHDPKAFAPNAKKVVVDIEPHGATVVADAKDFLEALYAQITSFQPFHQGWLDHCVKLREDYPSGPDEWTRQDHYSVLKIIHNIMPDDAIIITDAGFSFTVTFQATHLKRGQRLIYSPGVAPMGWGIPGAIGAAFACPGRQIVCLVGDGGAMLNIQELQTIAQHKLNITIIVAVNDGYLTMRNSQKTHFKRESMSVVLPDFIKVAKSFGIDTTRPFLKAPSLFVIHTDPNQVMAPRVQARMLLDGKFSATSLDDMWPHVEKVKYVDRNRQETLAPDREPGAVVGAAGA